jgi:ferredoxin
VPPVDALLRKLRTLLLTYRDAGGAAPVVLLHDAAHGEPLIDALARFGDGLPANALPLTVNETTQIGIEIIVAAMAYGAQAVRVLQRARPRHDPAGLVQTVALAEAILAGLGFGADRVALIETDDPDALGGALRALASTAAPSEPSRFVPIGAKRGIQRMALRELHRVAPAPVDVLALPAGAPFGTVEVRTEGCTLCLACVSACPTGALSDDPDRPMLRFSEDACVQCGLCKATCPEKVIGLTPRLDFRPGAADARVLKEEAPFPCVRCGKPFGVRSTIERITAKLAGRHWMFQGADQRLELLKMCEDCRVIVATEQELDPHAAPRPAVRTTEDYLRERAAGPKKPDA